MTSLGEVFSFGNFQQGQLGIILLTILLIIWLTFSFLGRQNYNSCKFEYPWNSFPARVDHIGPEYGRTATSVSVSGDYTFIKYDEKLFSLTNLLTSAKLIAERSNLILIPPRVRQTQNFDKLFEERLCKHVYCLEVDQNGIDHEPPKIVFNNLKRNVLIISRSTGAFSVLSREATKKTTKWYTLIDMENQINFELYSSVLLDKYYNNLWTYNAHRSEFARFNLIELEASSNIKHLSSSKSGWMASCCTNLPHLNAVIFPTIQYMSDVPSALQPDMCLPLVSNCSLKHSPQQLATELLSLLSSLTRSRLLGKHVMFKHFLFFITTAIFSLFRHDRKR